MRPLTRTLALLLVLGTAGPPAAGEEEAGTSCGMHALVDPGDAGLLVAYDGLRKGLELAQLPRVCRHDPSPETGGVAGFVERRAAADSTLRAAGRTVEPLFAVGDDSCAAVLATRTAVPCVMIVERWTVARKPLAPLPVPARGAVVHADLAAERLGPVLRSCLGKQAIHALLPVGEGGADAASAAFGKAAGLRLDVRSLQAMGAAADEFKSCEEDDVVVADLVLHLRVDRRRPGVDFARALALARRLGVPLVSDDRARFGHGAVVVLVPRHDLLGRAAADEARTLRKDASSRPVPRAVPGFEIWVDLGAADQQRVELPLAFLTRADKLRRGRRPAPKGTR